MAISRWVTRPADCHPRQRQANVRFAGFLALASVVALTAGCAQTLTGTAAAGEIDVRTLDVGDYTVTPAAVDDKASPSDANLLESIRMIDAFPLATDVDPAFSYNVVELVDDPDRAAEVFSLAAGLNVIAPTLKRQGMVVGTIQQAYDKEQPAGNAIAPDSKVLTVLLSRFPTDDAARRAAIELDTTDFNVSKENVAVPITKYPDARAHWRPNIGSIAATMAHGQFVMSVLVGYPTPNLDAMVGLITKSFDAQIPRIDAFTPTPVDKIKDLQVDPDDIMGKALDVEGFQPGVSKSYATYGPQGALIALFNKDHDEKLIADAGIDRLVIAYPAFLMRLRDTNAATGLLPKLYDSGKADRVRDIDAPKGVPGAKCFETKIDEADDPDSAFQCILTYRTYLAVVVAADDNDVRQRAAAQFALLANSQNG